MTPEKDDDLVRDEDLECEPFPKSHGGQVAGLPRGLKVTHKPSGLVVACEHPLLSQHKVRELAKEMILSGLTSKWWR